MGALLLLVPWIMQLADRRVWPPLFTRILTVRPTQGAVQRAIVIADDDPEEPRSERGSDPKA